MQTNSSCCSCYRMRKCFICGCDGDALVILDSRTCCPLRILPVPLVPSPKSFNPKLEIHGGLCSPIIKVIPFPILNLASSDRIQAVMMFWSEIFRNPPPWLYCLKSCHSTSPQPPSLHQNPPDCHHAFKIWSPCCSTRWIWGKRCRMWVTIVIAFSCWNSTWLVAQKMPLGKLTHEQVLRAYSVLTLLCTNLSTGLYNVDQVRNLSSRCSLMWLTQPASFYTLIPHNFGVRKPPLIQSLLDVKFKVEGVRWVVLARVVRALCPSSLVSLYLYLQERSIQIQVEMLEALVDMKITNAIMDECLNTNLIDGYYASLSCFCFGLVI